MTTNTLRVHQKYTSEREVSERVGVYLKFKNTENIIKYYGRCMDKYHDYCIQLTINNFDILQIKIVLNMDKELVMQWMKVLAETIMYIHSKNLIYNRISPKYVVIEQGTNKLMLNDFREACNNDTYHIVKPRGVPGYIAPEIIKNINKEHEPTSTIDYSSDVFSMGCVFYYMCTKKHYVNCAEMNIFGIRAVYADLEQNRVRDFIPTTTNIPSNIRPIICEMISYYKEERPTLQMVIDKLHEPDYEDQVSNLEAELNERNKKIIELNKKIEEMQEKEEALQMQITEFVNRTNHEEEENVQNVQHDVEMLNQNDWDFYEEVFTEIVCLY
jgi:serine/threonine protein kinase